MKKAYSYVRVSTDMQVEGYSLNAQKRVISNYCAALDIEIVGEYCDEGKSGKDIKNRPAFQTMLYDVKQNKDNIDYIIVFKLSRFGRSVIDILESTEQLMDYDVDLICVDDGIDTSKEMGRFLLKILAAVAELERENILIQTAAGRHQKASEGKWNGGVAPFGYKIDSESGALIVDNDTADIVRLIFQLYTKDELRFAEIADYLNMHGYKKPKYRERDLEYFQSNFIRSLLSNQVYIGKIVYGKSRTEKVKGTRGDYKRVKSDDYLIAEGEHQAIIDDETWGRAQLRLASNTRRRSNKHELPHEYLLSGILICPICGAEMSGTPIKRENKQTGKKYYDYYYRCHIRSYLEDGSRCSFTSLIREKELDQEVLDVVKLLISSEPCRQEILKELQRTVDISTIEKEIRQLRETLRKARGNKDLLTKEMDALDPDEKFFDMKRDDLKERINALYETIYVTERRIEECNLRARQIKNQNLNSEDIYNILVHFDYMYEKMTDTERKEFYETLIKDVEIHKDRSRSDRWVKSITFSFQMLYDGQEGNTVMLPKAKNVETVCLMSRVKD